MTLATGEQIPFEGPQPAPEPRAIRRGVKAAAWKLLVYGTPGIGKSTLAAAAPAPYFLDLENGIARIDCAGSPARLTTLTEVYDEIAWFKGQTEFQTLVVDTIDELEKMLSARVVAGWDKPDVKTVADIPYGRGGDLLVHAWRELLDGFDRLVAGGKNVLFTGHEQIIKFENPSDANFDFYAVNVHKKVAPVVTAKLDAVFYARYETFVTGVDEKKGKGKAGGQGRRVLHTQQGPSFIAKSRFQMPAVVPLDKNVFTFIK